MGCSLVSFLAGSDFIASVLVVIVKGCFRHHKIQRISSLFRDEIRYEAVNKLVHVEKMELLAWACKTISIVVLIEAASVFMSGQEFLKGIHSPKIPDMEALNSELANQARRPPPGESSPAETLETVVHEESATSDYTGMMYSIISLPLLFIFFPLFTSSDYCMSLYLSNVLWIVAHVVFCKLFSILLFWSKYFNHTKLMTYYYPWLLPQVKEAKLLLALIFFSPQQVENFGRIQRENQVPHQTAKLNKVRLRFKAKYCRNRLF